MIKKKLTNEEYIQRCKEKFGDKFDYSLTEYINSLNKIIVKCNVHDKYFYPQPSLHYVKGTGCPLCARQKISEKITEINKKRFKS